MKEVKLVRPRRKFSKEFKKQRVKEYEAGEFTALQLSRMFGLHVQTIYNWIYKYSKFNEKKIIVVEGKHSGTEKLKKYEQRIKELEQAVGQKQLLIEYLEKMIEIAKEDYGIDIKKNSDTQHLNGSQKIEK